MAAALAPSSVPCDGVGRPVKYRAMKVRACDGPYRGKWFRFYPAPTADDPFGGPYQTSMEAIDSRGKVTVYELHQSDDPKRWALTERIADE